MTLVFSDYEIVFFGDKYDRAVIGGRCAGVRRVPSLRVEESALNFWGESMTVEASFTDGLRHRTGCEVMDCRGFVVLSSLLFSSKLL